MVTRSLYGKYEKVQSSNANCSIFNLYSEETGTMIITKTSLLTGIENSVDVDITEDQFMEFLEGVDLDIVAPDLNVFDKRFILTGITIEEYANADNTVC